MKKSHKIPLQCSHSQKHRIFPYSFSNLVISFIDADHESEIKIWSHRTCCGVCAGNRLRARSRSPVIMNKVKHEIG